VSKETPGHASKQKSQYRFIFFFLKQTEGPGKIKYKRHFVPAEDTADLATPCVSAGISIQPGQQ